MIQIKTLIKRHLQARKILVLLLLTILFYSLMMIYSIPATLRSAQGMALLDLKYSGYDLAYVLELFNTIGASGRSNYLLLQIPLDMIYPALFAISNCLLISFLLNRLNKLDSWMFYMSFLPLIAGFADYFENFGIIEMLTSYPSIPSSIARVTNICTMIKSGASTAYLISLTAVFFVYLMHLTNKPKGGALRFKLR